MPVEWVCTKTLLTVLENDAFKHANGYIDIDTSLKWKIDENHDGKRKLVLFVRTHPDHASK
jgi:hypothetical protein